MTKEEEQRIEAAQEKLHQAFTEYVDAWDETTGSLVLNWIIVGEVASPDGEIRMTRCYSDHLVNWRALGMLETELKCWKRMTFK